MAVAGAPAGPGGDEVVASVAALRQDLRTKKTFTAACEGLAAVCEKGEALPEAGVQSLVEAGKSAFTVLQTRYSNPKFWQAGLDLFLALEFHLPTAAPDAASWREKAMEEVDDDARARAREQAKARRLLEDRMHNKGRFSDAATPITMAELLAANGMVLLGDETDDRRPAMSRDARYELRVVTVAQEDICVVCQEAMPAGSKAKSMPCGHLFHDDCLIAWVKKSNSCPTCRFDELPSEKRHFDDVQRRIEVTGPARTGIYS